MVYSILSFDLNKGVTDKQRDDFYAELRNNQWKQISALTTLWYATWNDDASSDGIVTKTKAEVEEAATKAGIQHYDASVAVSGKPVVWKK